MPLRVAAVLCLVVGMVTLIGGVAQAVPLAGGADGSWWPMAVGLVTPALIFAAAGLIWRRRRLGVLLLVVAWAIPTTVALLVGASPRGPAPLLVIVLVTIAANWRLLE